MRELLGGLQKQSGRGGEVGNAVRWREQNKLASPWEELAEMPPEWAETPDVQNNSTHAGPGLRGTGCCDW